MPTDFKGDACKQTTSAPEPWPRDWQKCRATGCSVPQSAGNKGGLCDWHNLIADTPENWSKLTQLLEQREFKAARKWLYLAELCGDFGAVEVLVDRYDPHEARAFPDAKGERKLMRIDECLGYALLSLGHMFPQADLSAPAKNRWGGAMTNRHYVTLLRERMERYVKKRFGKQSDGTRHLMTDDLREQFIKAGVLMPSARY